MKARQLEHAWPTIPNAQRTFAARAVVIVALLARIELTTDWHVRLRALITAHPNIDPATMGFSPDWDSQPHWN
jgi:hypothetical protein